MLPESSSTNIRLGFTTEEPEFDRGPLARSVNAAPAVFMANPIAMISAVLAKIGFFGDMRFMIAPRCNDGSETKLVNERLKVTDGEFRSFDFRGDPIERQRCQFRLLVSIKRRSFA